MNFIEQYLLVGGIFAAIDAFWIGIVANKFYKKRMGKLLLDKPKFGPAIIFYLIAIFAMVYFVVDPALKLAAYDFVPIHAAVLGLFGYATYDLTNASTIKGWPMSVTIVDMLWGTFVTTLTCSLAFLILN